MPPYIFIYYFEACYVPWICTPCFSYWQTQSNLLLCHSSAQSEMAEGTLWCHRSVFHYTQMLSYHNRKLHVVLYTKRTEINCMYICKSCTAELKMETWSLLPLLVKINHMLHTVHKDLLFSTESHKAIMWYGFINYRNDDNALYNHWNINVSSPQSCFLFFYILKTYDVAEV